MYTKGKWTVHEWGDKFQVVESKVEVIEKPGITMTGQLIIAKEVTLANAQLIASAPRMYKALEDALEASHNPVVEKILMEALAKVEGKDV